MPRWRNGTFCPSLGEASLTTVPFLVSRLREIGIPGLPSLWIYIASLTLGNTGSLQASALTQAHLQPLPEMSLFKAINPSCLKNLKVPRVKKKKKRIGTNSYFTLTWWKPVCLWKFTYHSGLIRPQKKKKKKLEVSWKHKQTFQKYSCLCWLSKSVLHDRKCSRITIKKKKCCFEGCVGEMNDGGGARMPQKEICL